VKTPKDTQTDSVETVDKHTQPVEIKIITLSTQTSLDQPAVAPKDTTETQTEPEKSEITAASTQTAPAPEPKGTKQKKRKKAKDKSVPLEVEVTAHVQFDEPRTAVQEPVEIVKTVTTGDDKVDSAEGLNVDITLNYEPPPTYCILNEPVSLDDNIGVTDYFTLLKAQEGPVDWQTITEQLQKRSPHPERHPISTEVDKEDDDREAEFQNLELLVNSLDTTPDRDADKVLLELVEKTAKLNEELENGLQNVDGLSDEQKKKRLVIYRITIVRIEEIIIKIITKVTKSTKNNRTQVVTVMNQMLRQSQTMKLEIDTSERQICEAISNTQVLTVEIDNLAERIDETKANLIKLQADDLSTIPEKLATVEDLEEQVRCLIVSLRMLTIKYQILCKHYSPNVIHIDQHTVELQLLENAIIAERNKLIQMNSLINEYEQTLHEFKEITTVAEVFIENPITTNSLEELQEEMQRYRKFFVNLNHCKAILESLESNLDNLTRQKHADLHSQLYKRTTTILEKAVDRAGKLALAASKWTMLEKEMINENQWLQVKIVDLHFILVKISL
jgi:nesprin-1